MLEHSVALFLLELAAGHSEGPASASAPASGSQGPVYLGGTMGQGEDGQADALPHIEIPAGQIPGCKSAIHSPVSVSRCRVSKEGSR